MLYHPGAIQRPSWSDLGPVWDNLDAILGHFQAILEAMAQKIQFYELASPHLSSKQRL